MLHAIKLGVFLAVFALVSAAAGCKPGSEPAAFASAEPTTPGTATFDYYVLSLSWSPEFCYSHPEAAECAEHSTFVLHGLWPENNDGTYPESCSTAAGPEDSSLYKDIYPDVGLLDHEWKKHGTCSGLGPDAFFKTARALYQSVTIPPGLARLTHQTSMTPSEILGLFTRNNRRIPPSSLSLSCAHNYLTAVQVCFDKSLHPTACTGLRSCRANAIRIIAP